MISIVAARGSPSLGSRIIRVNHAGEHGAVCIYSGQLVFARLWDAGLAAQLMEFREHERKHRASFSAELIRRGQRRCRSYWLCGIGGLVLGLVTGLLGPSAVAATTVAVESVVLRHLEEQVRCLAIGDPAGAKVVSAIIAEEREHHDRSALQSSSGTFWPRIITPIVSASTEAVIWLGMRL
jgi:3-demethoxyubiquinol 3-hydroxylase